MCVVYENYLLKQMENENVDPSIVERAMTHNVFKNINNCNFVTLVVDLDLANDTIIKVLQSLIVEVKESSMFFPNLGFFLE